MCLCVRPCAVHPVGLDRGLFAVVYLNLFRVL
jgi:hypothetical protein